MTYAIINPNTPFTADQVKVRASLLEKNKLWKINGGEKLLHLSEGETGFLRDIGLESFSERVKYEAFKTEEFQQLVQYFFQKGELLYIDYRELDDYAEDELKFLSTRLRERGEKDAAVVADFMEDYKTFTEEIGGNPWYITLYRENQQVKLYPNGVMYASFKRGKETEDLILTFYKEIFDLLGTPFSLSPVSVVEKEKIDHPLKNAHTYLTKLLDVSGDTAREQANLPKEEVDKINELLLSYTKEYENKMTYKK